MPRKCDITRRRDVSEKVVISLCLALLTCLGFHHAHDFVGVLGGPAGCTTVPAFTVHAEVGVADSEENLPRKGGSTGATRRTTTTTTEPMGSVNQSR